MGVGSIVGRERDQDTAWTRTLVWIEEGGNVHRFSLGSSCCVKGAELWSATGEAKEREGGRESALTYPFSHIYIY